MRNPAGVIRILVFVMVAVAAACAEPRRSAPAPRPNIILIMSDDMGFSDIGCYGGEINTPNLDGLAANGLRFTQFYNTSRCCPTRASLLTGLYPHQTNMGHMTGNQRLEGYQGEIGKNCVTLAEVLKGADYRTYMTGKWHVCRDTKPEGPKYNWPRQRGFEKFYGTIIGAGSFFDPTTLTRQNTMITPVNDPEYKPETFYYTDAISDNAVKYIRSHQKESPDKPFFLYIAYTAAHWPMHALEKDIAKYKGKYDGGYDPIRKRRFERVKELGLVDPKWDLTPQAGDWAAMEHKAWESRGMEVYAAMVDNMDQGIGRILGALKETGRFDDTLVLFLQDNGACAEGMGRRDQAKWHLKDPKPMGPDELQPKIWPPMRTRDGRAVLGGPKVMPGPADTYIGYGRAWANVSNTPFREYKHWVHEGGISTPLIAHWPKGLGRRGELEQQPGHLIDIMATCVDVAGATYPKTYKDQPIVPMEGVSLVPAFSGRDLKRSKPIFWEHEGNRALRKGKWKLVAKGAASKWELYDMEKDRTEMHNLAESLPEKVKEMAAEWEAYARRAKALPWPWNPQYGLDPAEIGSPKTVFDLKQGDSLPQENAPRAMGRPIRIDAVLKDRADGVIVAQGGSSAGYALYVKDGKLEFATRHHGELNVVTAAEELPAGKTRVGAALAKNGKVTLYVNDKAAAKGKVPGPLKMMPLDGLDVGRDQGGAVGRYETPCRFKGSIQSVRVEVNPASGKSQTAPLAPTKDYPIRPVAFTRVGFADEFWAPRMETNRTVTVRYCFKKCEETNRIANFARAGGLEKGPFKGIPFNDSDVYKVIEGAAYSLSLHPDPELDKYLDDLIAKIAAAQEPDGYLYTARRLFPPEKMPGMSGKKRWSNLRSGHELYNVGHLYEAAAAHFQATGKRTLLDVALKNADLLLKTFGPDALRGVPGHEEIEIGLVKLFRVTGNDRYLKLSQFFIDERGNAEGRKLYGEYAQDHKPVVDQAEPVGHAVRAGYLYAGMADVAALTGNEAYRRALDRIWENLIESKIYLTGGVGAVGGHEGFGRPYELPNRAYNETCAAIAIALWNHRMFLLHGDAKYIDVLERVVYNGFLSGIALTGDQFFYPNPLVSGGRYARSPWFGCACCPVNVVRFVPSLAGYVYAVKKDSIYVNLYAGGTSKIDAGGRTVTLKQETRYPWDGKVKIRVAPAPEGSFTLLLRIPGWVRNRVLPSDLYRYANGEKPRWSVSVNDRAVTARENDEGYVALNRDWKANDTVTLEMTMPVRRVEAHEELKADQGRIALERGPLVYCFEGIDNGGRLDDIVLDASATLAAEHRPDLLQGVTVIRAKAGRLSHKPDGTVKAEPAEVLAIPYYSWAHRDKGRMAVWLAATPSTARPVPLPTIASQSKVKASHVNQDINAVNDQIEPANSNDHDVPRFDWWSHRGTTEWLQYDFESPAKVSQVEVYWFDDEPRRGRCRVPQFWRVLYRKDDQWLPVEKPGNYGVVKDKFNTVTFKPVTTDGLRLEVQLQPNLSGGVMEWRVK